MSNEEVHEYTPLILEQICPACCAAIGGKCLEPTQWGKRYRETPHAARVIAAEQVMQAAAVLAGEKKAS